MKSGRTTERTGTEKTESYSCRRRLGRCRNHSRCSGRSGRKLSPKVSKATTGDNKTI